MRKLLVLGLFLICAGSTYAQIIPKIATDSTGQDTTALQSDVLDNIPTVSLDDDGGEGAQGASSSFVRGFDPFNSAANFNFFNVGFRVRGYNRDNSVTYMNGVKMANLDNGLPSSNQWSGLGDVTRNRTLSLGMQANPYGFGGIGNTTNIDTRASKQRRQTSISYTYTDRFVKNNLAISHSTGMSKKGWAFTFAGSRRYSDEGYVPGTYINAWSYFVGIDKQLTKNNLLSIVVFAAPSESGGQASATKEGFDLAGTKYYNPSWGYQDGKVRNSRVSKSNQPVAIVTQQITISKKTTLVNALSASVGERSFSRFEWVGGAANPSPDYYRNFPSYYLDALQDTVVGNQLSSYLRSNKDALQVNWQNLYNANRTNIETIDSVDGIANKSVTGRRSLYVLSEDVQYTKKFSFNTTLNSKVSDVTTITGGLSYQYQNTNYFARIADLLGGQFFVDEDQYASQDFPGNLSASQNDIRHPNRVLYNGDKWKYSYNMILNKGLGWLQSNFHFKKADMFVAGEVSNTNFWRQGNYQNGLYPNDSYGNSPINDFTNYAVKAGITYKINKQNYLYLNGEIATKAPEIRSAYLSPQIKNTTQSNLTNQDVQSIEGGYILNTPTIHTRLTGYYTTFKHGFDLQRFFDYNSGSQYIDYALSNINTVNFGGELGTEAKLTRTLTLNAMASVGRAYYDSRQMVTATQDNTNAPYPGYPPGTLVYTQNYRLPNSPQQVFSLGLNYRSPKYWYVDVTGTYSDQMWSAMSPDRRTIPGVQGLTPADSKWSTIIDQEKLPSAFTLNMRAGFSVKLRQIAGIKKSYLLLFSGGVSNILDNTNIISRARESGIYDRFSSGTFPSRYTYAQGRSFSIKATLRFY